MGVNNKLKATGQMSEDKSIESIQIDGQKHFNGAI